MQNAHIADATSSYGAGPATGRRLFMIPSGYFAGKLVAVYGRNPTTITLKSASPPYTLWGGETDIVTDAADHPFGAWMDPDGNIYVVYTKQATEELRFVKVTFANAVWTPGTPSTVYNADTNRFPSIVKDSYDRLWVSWSRLLAGNWTVRAKSSTDDGVTFGSGAADAGTALSADATSAYSRIGRRGNYLQCFYTTDGTVLSVRFRHIDNLIWESAQTIYTGTGLSDEFSDGVSPDGRVMVAFLADSELHAKEYDGLAWSALFALSSDDVVAPAVRYADNRAIVFYSKSIGTDQRRVYQRQRLLTGFDTEQAVMPSFAPFDSVYCYDDDAGTAWSDQTAATADSTAADCAHPTSNALLDAVNDAAYLGHSDRFHLLKSILSTNGAGGTVTWQYWNGNGWTTFTPESGAYAFDSSPATVRLWQDLDGAPADWQKSTIQQTTMYWVRATVATAFTTDPVGTQLTAVPKTEDFTVLEPTA